MRERDPARYIEWRVEDLVPLTIEQHSMVHDSLAAWRAAHPDAWNKGVSPSEETKKKISRRLSGRFTGEESRFWKAVVHDMEDEIAAEYLGGASQREIAQKYGCSQGMIHYVLDNALGEDGMRAEYAKRKTRLGAASRGASNGNSSGAVVQISMSGEVLKTWPCMADAARALGVKNISRAVSTGKTAGGFRWQKA